MTLQVPQTTQSAVNEKECSTKSCCKHADKDDHNKNDEDKDGCCKDGCHCFCCIKLITNDVITLPTIFTNDFPTKEIIGYSKVYSFEYENNLEIPPQI